VKATRSSPVTKDVKNVFSKIECVSTVKHSTIPMNMISSESKIHCRSAVRFVSGVPRLPYKRFEHIELPALMDVALLLRKK